MPRQDSPLVRSCLKTKNTDLDLIGPTSSSSESDFSLKRKLKKKRPLLRLKKRKTVKPLTQVYSSDGSQSPVFPKKRLACPIPAISFPEILRGDREQSFVLQELQAANLSPPETNPEVNSYFQATSNFNEVKSLKNLDVWLSKENQLESVSTDQAEHKALLSVKNCVCAASSPGLDNHQLDDWNLSAIPSRLPSLSDVGEDSLNQQKTKALFPTSPEKNLQIKTYEKKVCIRKPCKVDTDHLTKDPYQFTSDSADSDFITKNPRTRFSYLTNKPSRSGQLSCTTPAVPCGRSQSPGCRSESPARMPSEKDVSVILITDDDESGLETRKKKKSKADTSTPVLVHYKHITLRVEDYLTLEEGEFLNDNIIEFFLTYLKEDVLNPEERDKVHMFSTYFYGALTKTKKGVDFEKDRSLTEAQRQYKRVERWTKNIDLFEKDMVIFPICVESHWLLIIAIKPGLINCPPKSEERTIKGEPFLILLDSMGGDNDKLVAKIRQYLTEEWKAKTGGKETFGKREVRLVKPEKPEQLNFTDCGVYLLQYIEKMFRSVAQFYWLKLPDLTDWFPLEEILRKRHEMAQHIQNMARVELQDSCPKFPEIRLNTEDDIVVKKSKRRKAKGELNYDEDFEDLLFKDDKLEKRKSSLRRKKSPERHNTRPKRKLLPVDKSGVEESPDSGQENDQFGDPLLSMKQKLTLSYKIPRRKGGCANLNEDQILDVLDKQEPKESHEPGATRERKKSKRTAETKSERNAGSNSEDSAESAEKNTVIDPSTREMLPPGEVPDLERTKFKQFLAEHKSADSPAHRPSDKPAHRPADSPAHRPADKPADKERTEKEGFNQYMDNKKSRKSERDLPDVEEYNSDKYKDSRENSPTKGENNIRLECKEKKAKEGVKKEPNYVVGKEVKEESRKEVASKLKKKKKDKSSFVHILKNDWESDASSECSPSRKKKYIPSLNMPTIELSPSPPLYPTPSNPSSKPTPSNAASKTRLTSNYSTNSLSRLKKKSHQHIIKHKNVDAKILMSRAPRGNPGKHFTAVVIPQVTTTAASPPRNVANGGANSSSNGAGGNQLPKFPLMAPSDKQMRLFSARSSCSDQQSNDSSYGDILR